VSQLELAGAHHPEAAKHAKEILDEQDQIEELGDLFKMLADPTRLRVLMTLKSGELCVADLSAVLGMSQSAISHQLADLKSARLVKSEKRGKHVYYHFDDAHVETIFLQALEHVGERYGTHRTDD